MDLFVSGKPVLSILCIIGAMKDVEATGSTAPVSELCFCSSTSGLAVGNQLGLVCVYNFSSISKETSLHIVTGTKKEICIFEPKRARAKDLDKSVDKLMFICTKDATMYVYDGYDCRTLSSKPVQLKRDTTAISMHVIEGNTSVVEPTKGVAKVNERCCIKKGTFY